MDTEANYGKSFPPVAENVCRHDSQFYDFKKYYTAYIWDLFSPHPASMGEEMNQRH